MKTPREYIKDFSFALLDRRKTRGFHLMNDLRYWMQGRPVTTIFDIGANIGQTVFRMREYFPKAHIEAFEPIDTTFQELTYACAGLHNVSLNHLALGSQSGQRHIRMAAESVLNSLLNQVDSSDELGMLPNVENIQTVNISTVDEVCAAKSIQHINILKTDTEGFDLEVLRGGTEMLAQSHIDFVMSEVGFTNHADYPTPFCSINEFLTDFGYHVAGFYDIEHRQGFTPSIHYSNVLWSSPVLSGNTNLTH